LYTEGFDPVPTQLLRKYIAYARKYVYPSLSSEAADVIQVHTYIRTYIFMYAQLYLHDNNKLDCIQSGPIGPLE